MYVSKQMLGKSHEDTSNWCFFGEGTEIGYLDREGRLIIICNV